MWVDRITPGELRPAQPAPPEVCHAGHRHGSARLSRRGLLQTAGAAAIGAVAGPVIAARGAEAAGPSVELALPIPGTLEFFGSDYHVQAPPFTGLDSDPATVNNFRGASGIAFISGMCERRDRRTGVTEELPYLMNDMRFMQGVFRGHDGRERSATFGFI